MCLGLYPSALPPPPPISQVYEALKKCKSVHIVVTFGSKQILRIIFQETRRRVFGSSLWGSPAPILKLTVLTSEEAGRMTDLCVIQKKKTSSSLKRLGLFAVQ